MYPHDSRNVSLLYTIRYSSTYPHSVILTSSSAIKVNVPSSPDPVANANLIQNTNPVAITQDRYTLHLAIRAFHLRTSEICSISRLLTASGHIGVALLNREGMIDECRGSWMDPKSTRIPSHATV